MSTREHILTQLQDLEDSWSVILAGLSSEQANKQPAPGRWSVAQNLDHVNIAARRYLDVIGQVVKDSKDRGLSVRPDTLPGKLLLYVMRPPYRFKAKAPKVTYPAATIDVAATYAEFIKLNERMRQMFKDFSDRELGAARLSSPLIKWIKLSAKQAIEVLIVHGQRHLFQVRAIQR